MSRSRVFNRLGFREGGVKIADMESMSIISNLSSSFLQSVVSTALQGTGVTTKASGKSISGIGAPSDNGQLSPFAQLMSTLQQLQQSDPAKYQQATQQIATNLQSAAQTDLANGNPAAANQLNQLATDFTNASKSGQLPSVQDLAQAIGGHHRHHHHSASADPDASAASSSSATASSSTSSQSLGQLLSSFQANGTSTDPLNPMSIILNTLSDAGISGSNG
jgi:hypothetical protein